MIKVKSTTYICCIFTRNSAICKLKKGEDHHTSGLLLTKTGGSINDPGPRELEMGVQANKQKCYQHKKKGKIEIAHPSCLNIVLSSGESSVKIISFLPQSLITKINTEVCSSLLFYLTRWLVSSGSKRQDMFRPFSQHKHWRDWKDSAGINLSNHWNPKPNNYLSRKIEKTHVLAHRWICFPPLRTNMSLNETSYWQRKAEQG